MLDPPKKPEAYIIPPDPAIVEGLAVPGEKVYDNSVQVEGQSIKHAKTIPLDKREEEAEMPSASPKSLLHTTSAPSRITSITTLTNTSHGHTHTPSESPREPPGSSS